MAISFTKYYLTRVAMLIIMLSLVCVSGCKDTPKDVIPRGKLIDLLVDMTIAESVEQGNTARELPDSLRFHLTESVLREHGVTRVQLDSTMSWYGRNLDDYVKLYSEVDKRLQKRIRKESGSHETEREADNMWPLRDHYWFTPLSADGALVFELPGDGVGKGESLDWSMVFSSSPTIDMLLGVDYTNGSATFIKRTYRGDRRLLLTLITDTALQVKRIYGVLRVEEAGMPAWVDSIRLVKNPYDSTAHASWSQKRYYGPKRHIKTEVVDENDGGDGDKSVSDSSEQNGNNETRNGTSSVHGRPGATKTGIISGQGNKNMLRD